MLELIEFRDVGGLQGGKEAVSQAIYDNLKNIIDHINGKSPKTKKES